MNRKLDEKLLREELARHSFDMNAYEQSMSTNIFYVEKELGVFVTDEYPIVKLFNQIDELAMHYKRELEHTKKLKR